MASSADHPRVTLFGNSTPLARPRAASLNANQHGLRSRCAHARTPLTVLPKTPHLGAHNPQEKFCAPTGVNPKPFASPLGASTQPAQGFLIEVACKTHPFARP